MFDCPDSILVEHGDFARRFKASLVQNRIPVNGSLEVTFRCNLRCVHCYLGEYRSGIPQMSELSLGEIYHILDEVTDAGCMEFLLTGGEPFVRPDLLDIYDYAKNKGLLMALFTNGTLITPGIADHLADLPPQMTEITLYGATEATYEQVTGIPGSYRRCLRGIDLLLEKEIPLKLKTMLLTLNQHELKAMQQFAAQRGVEFRYDPLLNGGLDGGGIALPFRVAPEQVVETELQDPVRGPEMEDYFQRMVQVKPDNRYVYTCGAGLYNFHIDSYGRMSPCITSRARTYDLRHGTFKEGWENFLLKERSLPSTRETRCHTCPIHGACEQCVGRAYTEGGDPEEPVDYVCQLAHLRANAFRL